MAKRHSVHSFGIQQELLNEIPFWRRIFKSFHLRLHKIFMKNSSKKKSCEKRGDLEMRMMG